MITGLRGFRIGLWGFQSGLGEVPMKAVRKQGFLGVWGLGFRIPMIRV